MKQTFINKVKNGAIISYKKYGILPSLVISQAILESGWGKHHIENNLFGIKATSSWTGKVAIRKTTEYKNGKPYTIPAKFRAYDSFDESIEDHAKVLSTSKVGKKLRYEDVLKSKDYKEACINVQKAGYATDPNYTKTLIKLIEQNKLYEIDNEVKKMSEVKKHEPSNWAEKSWDWGTKEGLVDGKNPKESATREQVIEIIYRMVNKK